MLTALGRLADKMVEPLLRVRVEVPVQEGLVPLLQLLVVLEVQLVGVVQGFPLLLGYLAEAFRTQQVGGHWRSPLKDRMNTVSPVARQTDSYVCRTE
ncbi:hypothetical protein [Azospirillum sp. sgz302134]